MSFIRLLEDTTLTDMVFNIISWIVTLEESACRLEIVTLRPQHTDKIQGFAPLRMARSIPIRFTRKSPLTPLSLMKQVS